MASKFLKFGFIALFLTIALSTPAFAAKEGGNAVKASPPRPVFDPTAGTSFCLTDYRYPDGRQLTIALSSAEEINLGLTIPEAGFMPKRDYALTLWFDQKAPQDIRATAMDENSLLIRMGNNPPFARELTASKTLVVSAGGTTMRFAMRDIKVVYTALKRCNKGHAKSTSSKRSSTGNEQQAIPETLKALLRAAGAKEIKPLSMEDIPPEERTADFVWQTGNLLGGIRERKVPKKNDLSKLIGLHINGLKQKCSGVFKTEIGKEEKAPEITLRPANVLCQMETSEGTQAIFVALLFYTTVKNLFTVFTFEGLVDDKGDAMAARDALHEVLVKLSQTPIND